jgi:hypothetical protein
MAFTLLQHLLSMVQAKLVAGSRKRAGRAWGGRHDGREPQHELAEGGPHEPRCRDPEQVAGQIPGTPRTQASVSAGPSLTGTMTAYLGGASPVLHLWDSRLWWGVGT